MKETEELEIAVVRSQRRAGWGHTLGPSGRQQQFTFQPWQCQAVVRSSGLILADRSQSHVRGRKKQAREKAPSRHRTSPSCSGHPSVPSATPGEPKHPSQRTLGEGPCPAHHLAIPGTQTRLPLLCYSAFRQYPSTVSCDSEGPHPTPEVGTWNPSN